MSHTCQPWMALSFLSGCDVPLPSSSVTPLSSTLSSRESFRQAVPLSIYSRSQLCVWGRGTVLWKLQRVATWGRSRPPPGEDPSWGRPCTHAHRTCSFSDPCWLTFWKLQCEPSHEPAALLCETLMTRGSLSHVLLSENTPSGSCVCCSYITKTGFSILSRFCHPAVASWGVWSCWTCGETCTCMGVRTPAWDCRLGCFLSCPFQSPVALLESERGLPSLARWLPWFTIAPGGMSPVLFLAWYPLPFPAGFPPTACMLAVL